MCKNVKLNNEKVNLEMWKPSYKLTCEVSLNLDTHKLSDMVGGPINTCTRHAIETSQACIFSHAKLQRQNLLCIPCMCNV